MTSTRRQRRMARNKRKGGEFPTNTFAVKAPPPASSSSSSSNTTTASPRKATKNKKAYQQKQNITYHFFIVVLPLVTVPLFLVLDFQTPRNTLWSLCYLWLGATFIVLAYKYRNEMYASVWMIGSNSTDRSTRRSRGKGGARRHTKSTAEVKYNDLVREKKVRPTKDVSLDDMNKCLKNRGNIRGMYNCLKKYKALYTSEQQEKRRKKKTEGGGGGGGGGGGSGGAETTETTQYKLNESQFRGLVQAVGQARNRLMSNLNIQEVFVTVSYYDQKENETVVDFQSLLTRDVFDALNET